MKKIRLNSKILNLEYPYTLDQYFSEKDDIYMTIYNEKKDITYKIKIPILIKMLMEYERIAGQRQIKDEIKKIIGVNNQ